MAVARSGVPATQEEFEAWVMGPDGPECGRYEFVFGHVVAEPPARWQHGGVGATIAARLSGHVADRGLGRVLDSSAGYALPSGDTLSPDVSVILKPTWDAGPAPTHGGLLRVVPDLVVEILSPSTRRLDLGPRREIYARNGVREYWLVDWQAGTITVLVPDGRGDLVTDQTARGSVAAHSRLLPGLALRPDDVFSAAS